MQSLKVPRQLLKCVIPCSVAAHSATAMLSMTILIMAVDCSIAGERTSTGESPNDEDNCQHIKQNQMLCLLSYHSYHSECCTAWPKAPAMPGDLSLQAESRYYGCQHTPQIASKGRHAAMQSYKESGIHLLNATVPCMRRWGWP